MSIAVHLQTCICCTDINQYAWWKLIITHRDSNTPEKHTFQILSILLKFSLPPSCRSRSRTQEGQERTLRLLPNLHCQADVVRVFPAILVAWCTNWQATCHEEASTYTIPCAPGNRITREELQCISVRSPELWDKMLSAPHCRIPTTSEPLAQHLT